MIKSIVVAAAFSLLYMTFYPVLRGEFVIYVYPPWSVWQAGGYIVGGVVLQGWFCFGGKRLLSGDRLLVQITAGVLYAAAIFALSGGLYQS